MSAKSFLPLTGLIILGAFVALAHQSPSTGNVPTYTSSGELNLPENYREWVYLSTGFDMSYNPAMSMDHHMFDNVFVNPESYRAFLKTGSWPDKTIFVLEGRRAENKGSINQAGHFQSGNVMGLEVHIKDESHFAKQGNWAFFGFDEGKSAKMIPVAADCYSCHAKHAAVDTTFVQFYPTLLPIAQARGTLSPAYLKEFPAAAAPANSSKSSDAYHTP